MGGVGEKREASGGKTAGGKRRGKEMEQMDGRCFETE